MELDETDPAIWLKLEGAVDEYIQNSSLAFKSACERLLLPFQQDDKLCENLRSQYFSNAKATSTGIGNHFHFSPLDFCLLGYVFAVKTYHLRAVEGEKSPSLGWRRNVLLVEASHSPDSGRVLHHARTLESFCSRNGIRLSLMQGITGFVKTIPATTFPTPFASPMFTGSFPSSPLLYSPDVGALRVGRIDMVPPLSLDGQTVKTAASSPKSSPGPRQLSLPVQSLHEKLQNSPQVGIIHLALQNDSLGSILRSTCSHVLLFLIVILVWS